MTAAEAASGSGPRSTPCWRTGRTTSTTAELDELAGLFTEDALFVTGALELRGRVKIKNRYLERTVVRSTRHTYSGLRVSAIAADPEAVRADRRRAGPPGPGARLVHLGQLRGQRGAAASTTSASTSWPTSTTC